MNNFAFISILLVLLQSSIQGSAYVLSTSEKCSRVEVTSADALQEICSTAPLGYYYRNDVDVCIPAHGRTENDCMSMVESGGYSPKYHFSTFEECAAECVITKSI